MPMWLVWTIVAVAGIVLLRALWEGSWERIKVLGLSVAAALVARGAGWLDGHLAQWPWGIGTFSSAMCGVVGLVLWVLAVIGVLKAVFEGLENLKASNGY